MGCSTIGLVGGLIPGSSRLHVKVSFGTILNPESVRVCQC